MSSVATVRASDDDRDRVVAVLRDASVAGRISYDTLVERIDSEDRACHLRPTRPDEAGHADDLTAT